MLQNTVAHQDGRLIRKPDSAITAYEISAPRTTSISTEKQSCVTLLIGLLTGTAALALVAVHAQAADMPSRYAPAPVYDAMPGFRLDRLLCGRECRIRLEHGNDRYYDPAFGYVGSNSNGGFVGGGDRSATIYQMGMFVIGAETDIQYAAVGNKGSVVQCAILRR